MKSFKDVPDDLVRSVRAPTLIVLGDQDIVKPEHAVELARMISGARLLILPGGHGDYLGEAVMTQKDTRYPELTAQLITEFLDSVFKRGEAGIMHQSKGSARRFSMGSQLLEVLLQIAVLRSSGSGFFTRENHVCSVIAFWFTRYSSVRRSLTSV